MRLLTFPFEEQPIEDAIATSRSAFALAQLALERSSEPAAVIGAVGLAPGETIVLGALQHAARVVPGAFDAGAKVVRRATSGTGFRIDGGLLLMIAYSSADAAFADVTSRTLLNRCVRPFLSGLSRGGLDSTYLGREWIAYRRQALGVLGLDVSPRGSVLIEAWLNESGSFVIPRSIASPLEASCDRSRGKPTIGLDVVAPGGSRELAARFVEGAADRLGDVARVIREMPDLDRVDALVTAAESPLPREARVAVPVEIPIGFMDVAEAPGGSSWVGGDMLAPTFALGFDPPVAVEQLPMEGARWENVGRARESLRTT
ncbi:MAG: hypothetical protein JNK04_22820 [Myxococcales bacterium]|nr:hypothetical protein [Myxococcales bacterium]